MNWITYYLRMPIKNTLKVRLYFLASFLYTALILVLSLVNLEKVELVNLNVSDKFYHGVCYAIMMFLWSFYFSAWLFKFQFKQKAILAIVIVTFGIIIEILQLTLTSHRTFDWWDVVANGIGVLLGLSVFSILQYQFNL